METCPKCGYCPHCQRSSPYWHQQPTYWQFPPYMWPNVATSGYVQVNDELTNPVTTTTSITTTLDPATE